MTEGKCWDNKENRILNIKKENENKKEKQKTEIPNIKRFQELLNGSPGTGGRPSDPKYN